MRDINRRAFLSATAAATALGGSELAASADSNSNDDSSTGNSVPDQFQCDAGNSGFAAGRTGPTRYLHETAISTEMERGVEVSPVADDDHVYVISGSWSDEEPAELFALDADSLETVWKQEFHMYSRATRMGSPILTDSHIVVMDGSSIRTFDTETSEEVWATDLGEERFPYNIPAATSDTMYAVIHDQMGEEILLALDIDSGEVRWQTDQFDVTTPPTVADDVVYVGRYVDSKGTEQLVAFDAKTGTERWAVEQELQGIPTVADGTIYVPHEGDGFHALDAESGRKLWGVDQERGIRPDIDSVAVANGRVFYVGLDTTDAVSSQGIYAYDAGTGEQLWSVLNDTDLKPCTAPVVADGVVYVGETLRGMVSIDAESGELLGQYLSEGWSNDPSMPPTIRDGKAYLGTYADSGPNLGDLRIVESGSRDDSAGRPAVQFDSPPKTVAAGEEVRFTALADPSPGFSRSDTIIEYRWDFDGDGTVDLKTDTESPNAYHTFEEAGTYDVSVTVEDELGWTATAETTVEVTERDEGAPVARIDTTPEDAANRGLPYCAVVDFDARASSGGDTSVERYEWDLNDDGEYEESGPTASVQMNHDVGQELVVGLRVVAEDGETDTATVRLQRT